VKAEATLRELFPKAVRSSAEKDAQAAAGAAGKADDVGGHIIGHRFVKDQGPKNLFPQNVQFNNSAYRKMENEWAAWVGKGKEVQVDVRLVGNNPARPDRVQVSYEVFDPKNGALEYARSKSFKNEAGQTFDRVPSKDMK
jgi:spore maturation protein CgeB